MEQRNNLAVKMYSKPEFQNTCKALNNLNQIVTNLNELSLLIETTNVLNGIDCDMPETAKDICDFENLIEMMDKFMAMRALLLSPWLDHDAIYQQLQQLSDNSDSKPQ